MDLREMFSLYAPRKRKKFVILNVFNKLRWVWQQQRFLDSMNMLGRFVKKAGCYARPLYA